VNTNDENEGKFGPKARFSQPGRDKSDRLLGQGSEWIPLHEVPPPEDQPGQVYERVSHSPDQTLCASSDWWIWFPGAGFLAAHQSVEASITILTVRLAE